MEIAPIKSGFLRMIFTTELAENTEILHFPTKLESEDKSQIAPVDALCGSLVASVLCGKIDGDNFMIEA